MVSVNGGRRKREKYEGFLKRIPIFASVDPYDMALMTDALKPVKYKAGEYLIHEVRIEESSYY